MKILNIGCGINKIKDAVNVDIREDVKPDLVLDIRYLEGIEDNSIDKIYQ